METSHSSLASIFQQLNSLIGIDRIKEDIRQQRIFISNFSGSKGTLSSKFHCRITGAVDSGKRTLANILAAFYATLGVISYNVVSPVWRTDLLEENDELGTIRKTLNLLDEKKGGIIYFHEASKIWAEEEDICGKAAWRIIINKMTGSERTVFLFADKLPHSLSYEIFKPQDILRELHVSPPRTTCRLFTPLPEDCEEVNSNEP